MNTRRLLLTTACLAMVAAGVALNWHSFSGKATAAQAVNFNRDIRPILSRNCTSCHGGIKAAGNVSFVYREQALGRGKSGRTVIAPGKPGQSELMRRVQSPDAEVRMPYHAPPLEAKQIGLLKQWIEEGAPWEEHWAFEAPKQAALPKVRQEGWSKRPWDRFVLARLEQEGLKPAAETDKATLLRRVSLDLTGLPPTPEETAAFEADGAADAYEKQVDRLLASPAYGERWASMWLDLARYSDSNGYEKDADRLAWPYRDWVIEAFNANLPYDQFVIRQLAGDLLPRRTLPDQIATTFHRLTPTNDEDGVDFEEYRLTAVMDRVATTWGVVGGVTFGCVQCHAHPYDPIRHDEYYKFLAFFNNTADANYRNAAPLLWVPKESVHYGQAQQMQQQMQELQHRIVSRGLQVAKALPQWTPLPIQAAAADTIAGLKLRLAQAQRSKDKERNEWIAEIEGQIAAARAAKKPAVTFRLENGTAVAMGTPPAQVVNEFIAPVALPQLTALRLEVPPQDEAKARHTPEDGFIVDDIDAWVVGPDGRETRLDFRYFVPDAESNLSEKSTGRTPSDQYSLYATGARVFAGEPKLFQRRWTVAIPAVPAQLQPGSKLKVHLTHTQTISSRPMTATRVRLAASGEAGWTALAQDPELTTQLNQLWSLQAQLQRMPGVGLPVMVERSPHEQRETREFERGNFLTKVGAALSPDVPALFPKLPANAPRNRLTLAQWFFQPGQPLTARVAVNRYWEQLFGTGIVETLEDFGSAGELPSHPELLDWLAVHFERELHWDMKALLKELATSAVYRQSAQASPEMLRKDPRNRLLARGPRQRLTAEMVRDQALLASGLLSRKMGGPSVMPPQPAGLWRSPWSDEKWVDAQGEDRYRRAVYTYLKRSAPYPSMMTFDAPARLVSAARRIVTNTPLQALVTLNDPVFHEASEALAKRMSMAGTLQAQLLEGARRVLSREPTEQELETLQSLYEDMRADAAAERREHTATASTAALTNVASVLFNLDAALTR